MMSLNPLDLYPTQARGFSQGVVHAQTLYASGLVGLDKHRQLPGQKGFEAQFQQAIANLYQLLAAAHLDWSQVIHLGFYVVGLEDQQTAQITQFLLETFPESYQPATTIVGVARLARKEFVIEIECIAQLPA